MTEWKRICCAVDPSEASLCAMQQAAQLARSLGAELTLVHVRTLPPMSAMDLFAASGAPEAGPDRALAAWRVDAERIAGAPVRIVLLTGRPADTIVRYAREQGFDVIVVGTRHGSTLGRLVLGSVAERVALSAPCPVLVARPCLAREREASREERATAAII